MNNKYNIISPEFLIFKTWRIGRISHFYGELRWNSEDTSCQRTVFDPWLKGEIHDFLLSFITLTELVRELLWIISLLFLVPHFQAFGWSWDWKERKCQARDSRRYNQSTSRSRQDVFSGQAWVTYRLPQVVSLNLIILEPNYYFSADSKNKFESRKISFLLIKKSFKWWDFAMSLWQTGVKSRPITCDDIRNFWNRRGPVRSWW